MTQYIVFMGVSGVGKTTTAGRFAELVGSAPVLEADDLHPIANKQKMAAGTPLNDDDRMPWLDIMNSALKDRDEKIVVATCSALKRRYRERLARGLEGKILFVFLSSPKEEIAQRAATRKHEYMPVSLLDSQLNTLEAPEADEPAVTVRSRGTIEDTLTAVVEAVAPLVPGVLRQEAWQTSGVSNSTSGTGTSGS